MGGGVYVGQTACTKRCNVGAIKLKALIFTRSTSMKNGHFAFLGPSLGLKGNVRCSGSLEFGKSLVDFLY